MRLVRALMVTEFEGGVVDLVDGPDAAAVVEGEIDVKTVPSGQMQNGNGIECALAAGNCADSNVGASDVFGQGGTLPPDILGQGACGKSSPGIRRRSRIRSAGDIAERSVLSGSDGAKRYRKKENSEQGTHSHRASVRYKWR